MPFTVYILASRKNGTLYIGRSENLAKRIWDHKHGVVEGFTKKYSIKILVHAEHFEDSLAAASRERQLKKWNRQWKIDLIESHNPDWKDLFNQVNM